MKNLLKLSLLFLSFTFVNPNKTFAMIKDHEEDLEINGSFSADSFQVDGTKVIIQGEAEADDFTVRLPALLISKEAKFQKAFFDYLLVLTGNLKAKDSRFNQITINNQKSQSQICLINSTVTNDIKFIGDEGIVYANRLTKLGGPIINGKLIIVNSCPN